MWSAEFSFQTCAITPGDFGAAAIFVKLRRLEIVNQVEFVKLI